jgi:hypothetical protein
VKPDKLDEFEKLISLIKTEQEKQPGCICVKYMKRFYTFDGVENGKTPRELTKIVKCVKYYSYLEFNTIENCGKANGWFFDNYAKDIMKLLIMPFDINSGYSI